MLASTSNTKLRTAPPCPMYEDRLMQKVNEWQVLTYIYWFFGIALLIPIWMGSHFPTEDGLAHMYWMNVYRELAVTSSFWEAFYLRNVHLSTPHHLLYFALEYAVSGVFEPHLAQKIISSLLILAWVATVHFVSISICGELTLGALASLLLIHSAWLYGGFFGFLIGILILLISLALLARIFAPSRTASPTRLFVILSVMGIVAYYSHLVCAGLFLILVFLAILFYSRRFPSRVLLLAVATLPTCLLIISYLLYGTFGAGSIRWETIQRSVARFVGLAFFRGFATPNLPFWFALALLGVVLTSLCFSAVRAFIRGELPDTRRFVLYVSAFLAVVYFVSPEYVGEAGNFNGRLQFAMWAWLLPTLPYRMSNRARAAVLIGVSLLLCWQVADYSLRVRRFNRTYAAVLERAESIPPGATLKSVLRYENAHFEGSFIRVLAHSPEDIAYHRRCVLLSAFHSSLPFYWVRNRPDVRDAPDYVLDLDQLPESRLLLVISRNNSSGASP